MYEKCIHSLEMYANAIRILSKGYLPISLLPLSKLKEILDEVKKVIPTYIISNWNGMSTYHRSK